MASFFLDIAIRAVLIAAGTAMLLWAMRIKTAATRHAAWTVVVIVMLLLPIWSMTGLTLPVRVLQPESSRSAEPVTAAPIPLDTIATVEAVAPATPLPSEPPRRIDSTIILIGVYVLGLGVLLARLAIGTVHANRLRRTATTIAGAATSTRCSTPITVGWLKPLMILPSGWQHWPSAQLDAVLTHEREHARRRDPLVQWFALFNRAVFWFHPLAWWLERRLATLAEEACDAAVLAAGHAPEAYADYLLDIARSMTREGHRIHVVGVAMPGSGLQPRLRKILDGAPTPHTSTMRLACTFACCAISSVLFAAASLAPAPPQQKFDVASIKIAGEKSPVSTRVTPSGILYGGVTVRMLIADAFGVKALSISSPDAATREVLDDRQRYDIEAKADHAVTAEQMKPMLQALLADRFKLSSHKDSRTESIYRLTSLPGGVKLQASTGEGEPVCGPAPEGGAVCKNMTMAAFADVLTNRMARVVVDETKLSGRYDFILKLDGTPGLNQMRAALASSADPGAAKAAWAAASNDWTSSSILTDIQKQLGLKLEADKAPVEHLVVDHVERPTPDFAGFTDSTTKVNAAVRIAPAQLATPQTRPADPQGAPGPQQFEVVSIKPCQAEVQSAGVATPRPGGRGGGAGGWQAQTTPGHVYWDCVTLASLVDQAYADREHPLLNTTGNAAPPRADGIGPEHPKRVRGGPSWVDADKFTIEAKVPVDLTAPALAGATGRNLANLPAEMARGLRALLEDRFQVKVRRVSEQQDMYALMVADGGLNKDRVTTPVSGDCLSREQYADFMATSTRPAPRTIAEAEAGPRICGGLFSTMSGMEYSSATFAQLASQLSSSMELFVLDRTGIDTKFNFKMKSGSGDSADQRLIAGVAQLGLKLQPLKAPAEFLMIDRAEKPRPNFPTGGVR